MKLWFIICYWDIDAGESFFHEVAKTSKQAISQAKKKNPQYRNCEFVAEEVEIDGYEIIVKEVPHA